MKMSFKGLSFFLALAMMAGCTKHESHEEESKKIEIQELPSDFFLPSQIWSLILANPTAPADGHGAPAGHGEGAGADGKVPDVGSKSQPIIFSPAQIILVEKNPGVLKWPQITIQFPLGGGKLDLKDYLTGVIGTFYVRFLFTAAEGEKEALEPEIYYWSRAKKRRIEDEVFGSGCNKIIELSTKKIAKEDKLGIKINTKDDRYLSVIAGHYFFVKRTPKDTQVSQIEITNSDLTQHLCEPIQNRKNAEKGTEHDSRSNHE